MILKKNPYTHVLKDFFSERKLKITFQYFKQLTCTLTSDWDAYWKQWRLRENLE